MSRELNSKVETDEVGIWQEDIMEKDNQARMNNLPVSYCAIERTIDFPVVV